MNEDRVCKSKDLAVSEQSGWGLFVLNSKFQLDAGLLENWTVQTCQLNVLLGTVIRSGTHNCHGARAFACHVMGNHVVLIRPRKTDSQKGIELKVTLWLLYLFFLILDSHLLLLPILHDFTPVWSFSLRGHRRHNMWYFVFVLLRTLARTSFNRELKGTILRHGSCILKSSV